LYETTFEARDLQRALSLNDDMIRHFWDEKQGGFYFTADDAESILIRNREVYDGAYPSGNSVAALNLLRLSRMTAKSEYEANAAQLLQTFSDSISQTPAAHTGLMMALDFTIGSSHEVVIVGNLQEQDTKTMLNALQSRFIPNKVVLYRPGQEEHPEIARYAEFTKSLSSRNGKATAYVCSNYQCDFPTTCIAKMLQLLDATA
jgi:uncharacterized protein YyaL (SSP411 family)